MALLHRKIHWPSKSDLLAFIDDESYFSLFFVLNIIQFANISWSQYSFLARHNTYHLRLKLMSFYCMTKPFFPRIWLLVSSWYLVHPLPGAKYPTDNECPLFYNKAIQVHWQQRSNEYSSEHLWDVTNIGQVSSLRGSAPVRSHSCRSQFWSLCGLVPGENLSFFLANVQKSNIENGIQYMKQRFLCT